MSNNCIYLIQEYKRDLLDIYPAERLLHGERHINYGHGCKTRNGTKVKFPNMMTMCGEIIRADLDFCYELYPSGMEIAGETQYPKEPTCKECKEAFMPGEM
jgi:hypothetical protein